MLFLLACASSDPVVLLDADPARPGDLGADGPYGAELYTRTYAARVIGRVRTDLVLPTEEAGDDLPVVVFIQGGAVEVERYHWLAAHLASRGYAVILPHHELNLALFTAGNGQDALLGAWNDPDFEARLGDVAAIGGHSLGAVTAAKGWLAEERFEALFLAAGIADPADDPQIREGSPMLSMVGENDQRIVPADVEAGFERFGSPRWFAEVEDLNHYGFTSDPTEKELAGDGPSTDPDTARIHVQDVLDAFLDGTLRDDADALGRFDANAFDSVEVHP